MPRDDLRPLSEAALDDTVIWSLVDAAPDAIVLADEIGQILLVNRQVETLFGYDRGELLGRPVEELLPHQSRSAHRAHRTRYRAAPQSRPMGAGLLLYGRRSDGTEFPVEISLSPVPTDDGLRIVAAIRDITQRLEAEARQHRTERELRLVEERERMARDLHDLVIQRLFATGMAAQSLHSRISDSALKARVADIADELDATIREIRSVIFGLQHSSDGDLGFRHKILAVVQDQRDALGFTPHVHFDGHLETADDDIAHHVLAILRESLSNIARHAHATRAEISLEMHDHLVLRVTDNGTGLASTRGHGDGLANMADRVRALGGTFDILPKVEGGTMIQCRIPMASPTCRSTR